jgi:hypothetical protein
MHRSKSVPVFTVFDEPSYGTSIPGAGAVHYIRNRPNVDGVVATTGQRRGKREAMEMAEIRTSTMFPPPDFESGAVCNKLLT